MTAWQRYWFSPAPCFDLAVVRVIACSVQLFWVLFFVDQYQMIQDLATLPDWHFEPLVILNLLNLPFGWASRPDEMVVEALFFVSIASGGLALIGLLTNLSLLVFAATSVYLQAYCYSFGDFHHPEAIMMVALAVLALSPSGRVLSVDAWLRNRTQPDELPGTLVQSEFAGWPIKLLQWFFVLMYASAVWSKLSSSGLDWANGYTLQFILAQDGLRWGSELGVWLSQFHTFILLSSIGVLVFQASFALAVIFPKLRWIYVPAGLCLHIGIFVTLRAAFFSWIALYAVFIPWSEVARRMVSYLKASDRGSIVASRGES